MARKHIVRKTVDLTESQGNALDQMIAAYNTEVGRVLGFTINIGQGAFIRALLKNHAQETGQPWPDDYPTPGGRRR